MPYFVLASAPSPPHQRQSDTKQPPYAEIPYPLYQLKAGCRTSLSTCETKLLPGPGRDELPAISAAATDHESVPRQRRSTHGAQHGSACQSTAGPQLRPSLPPAVTTTIPDAPSKRSHIVPAAAAVCAGPHGATVAEPARKFTVPLAVPATAVSGNVPPGPWGAHPTHPGRPADEPAAVSGAGLRAAAAAATGHPAATKPPVLLPAGGTIFGADTDVSGGRSSAGIPTTIRGPPRKPKQSGHALWVGNLPPGARVVDLKDHFAQDATEDILSVFLISKSSCAFVNYKTEEACAAAMARFHDSRLKGVRLVCRLRRSAASVPGGVPTGPAALVGTGARAEVDSGAGDAGGEVDGDVNGEEDEGGDGMPTVDEGAGAPAKDKYFIVKSLTVEDLEMSVRNGVWATQSHNEAALDKAYKTADAVYLIFSANKSGEYYGYARMTSPINQDPAAKISFAPPPTSAAAPVTEPGAAGAAGGTALNDPDQPTATITPASATAPRGRIIDDSARGTIFWEADGAAATADGDSGGNSNGDGGSGSGDEESPSPPLAGSGAGGAAWGKPFSVEWESTRRVPFFRTRGLKNAWNAGREVKIARDGTEIETRVGRRLIGLFGGVAGPGGREGGGDGRQCCLLLTLPAVYDASVNAASVDDASVDTAAIGSVAIDAASVDAASIDVASIDDDATALLLWMMLCWPCVDSTPVDAVGIDATSVASDSADIDAASVNVASADAASTKLPVVATREAVDTEAGIDANGRSYCDTRGVDS
ncbi:hypothetical protein V501_03271 [Pseudogymnoascus sp. VKM F-4519 (FW-2642)]|nr:hypothetical protein V501_03271 [Pseudogymnoascus sp. VKM F-4519 (FW-2642)]